jgi:hypothetical protein
MESTVNNPLAASSHPLEDQLDAIKQARRLHEQLVETHTLSAGEKSGIARQIVKVLFDLESGRNLPPHVRTVLFRLRVDADFRAGLTDGEGIRRVSEIWDHYERLEAAAS